MQFIFVSLYNKSIVRKIFMHKKFWKQTEHNGKGDDRKIRAAFMQREDIWF